MRVRDGDECGLLADRGVALVEVRDADRADEAVGLCLGHDLPGAVVVVERLVHQVEVEVVEAQVVERDLQDVQRFGAAVVVLLVRLPGW